MRFASLFLVLGLFLAPLLPVQAQESPRLGVGLQLTGSTVDSNIGPGVRFRTSVPINQDISFGLGAGLTGFIFQGRDDASYSFDPQASLIVTLPGPKQERFYVFGGAGTYVPFGNTNAVSGPTVHAGLGKVWLLSESSFFLEFAPTLFVGKETTDIILPVRIGVIF